MKLIIPRVDEPDWGSENNLNQAPVNMSISAQITGLIPGSNYTVLKFESASKVPTSNIKKSNTWAQSWIITPTSATHDMVDFDVIGSDQ